jgi:isoquinoline 1-oxidoreductase beta subunit
MPDIVVTGVLPVANIRFTLNSQVKVHRAVCATDCGQVVNPAIVDQQIRSGIVFGLNAAPVVEVHNCAEHGSARRHGRSSVPGIAPAVYNAISAATGKRIRRLPIQVALG